MCVYAIVINSTNSTIQAQKLRLRCGSIAARTTQHSVLYIVRAKRQKREHSDITETSHHQLLLGMVNEVKKLFADLLIRLEVTQKSAGNSARSCLLHTSHHHAHVPKIVRK